MQISNKAKGYLIMGLVGGVFLLWVSYVFLNRATTAGCIPPSVSIAYPFQTFRTPVDGNGSPDVLPPHAWQPQLSRQQMQEIRFYSVTSIVVYQSDIWFTTGDLLARYRPSTHELRTYVVEVDQEGEFVPWNLFVAHNDNGATLWGSGGSNAFGQPQPGKFTGILSRYDAENDRFEPILIEDRDGVLAEPRYVHITEDSQGALWLLMNERLFRFNPETNQVQRVLGPGAFWPTRDEYKPTEPPELLIHNLVSASDGTLWLAVRAEAWISSQLVIVRYDPHTEELEYHGPPPAIGDTYSVRLFVDSQNRLWASDYGWREFTEAEEWEWYQVVRSPVFITDRMEGSPFFQYAWVRPSQVYESSNGLFWFSSTAGLVRLDPRSREWCLITTLTQPVVEDDQQNLWLAGAGQLYKYALNR